MEHTLTWDARELTTCWQTVQSINCVGYTDGGLLRQEMAGWRPVSAGHYRAEFAVINSPPSNCSLAADGTGTCTPTSSFSPHYAPPSIDLCQTVRSRVVEFDLPATGEVAVTVP